MTFQALRHCWSPDCRRTTVFCELRVRAEKLLFSELLVLIELLLGLLVEGLQVFEDGHVLGVVGEDLLHVVDQHSELGSPVAHVIYSFYVVPDEL